MILLYSYLMSLSRSSFSSVLRMPLTLFIFFFFVNSCAIPPIDSEESSVTTPPPDSQESSFEVVQVFPISGSQNIPIDVQLEITLSNPIDPASVSPNNFQIEEFFTGGSVSISGTFSTNSSKLLVFTPARRFNYNSVYHISLVNKDSAIKDTNGDSLATLPAWQFTTELREIDTDKDGISDSRETNTYGTNSTKTDSDGDGLNDYAEIMAGLDPDNSSDAVFTSNNNHILDPVYYYQWHLKNKGSNTYGNTTATIDEDINIEPAWAITAGSPDIVVGVVDSGVQANHPDLKENLNLPLSYRYSDGVNDPTPTDAQMNDSWTYPYLEYAHGTACAGLIAARGWNNTGIRGVAPFVQIAGLNVFSSGKVSDFIDALARKNVDVSSNSWGPGSADLTVWDDIDAIEEGIVYGRQGKGIIYVFAAGNDNFNANTGSNVHNSRFVTNVAAVNANGIKASYSNYGTNILVSAPGGEFGDTAPAMITSDITGNIYGYDKENHFNISENPNGDYTYLMNGTSSATPVISGVAALILQVNPSLTYRDVQYLLATTARKPTNTINDSEWQIGVTKDFNRKYGFGVVDAEAAVTAALTFEGLTPELASQKYTKPVNMPIPDNSNTGVQSSILVDESITIENVYIWVTTTSHGRLGDLEVIITAPSGTTSKLAYYSGMTIDSVKYDNWQFLSVRHLDEISAGNWTLTVRDLRYSQAADLTSWSLQIFGRE
jgi:subtilisin family serine protease